MEIAGLVKTSLIDYPGFIAAVVFTQGCNFRCRFCHNPDLLPKSKGSISEKEFFDFLTSRKDVLDGVVITGGEPAIQKDIKEFIGKIKKLGFLVKFDTNGSNPKLLDDLIDSKLVDYVAMDIKGPLEKYHEICGVLNTKVIQQSIHILLNSSTNYEFRTTVLPLFHDLKDMEEMGKMIKGAPLYTLQGFRPLNTFDKMLSKGRAFTREELEDMASVMEKYVKKVVIHDNI